VPSESFHDALRLTGGTTAVNDGLRRRLPTVVAPV
jgi:hypothetical protein